MPAQETFWAHRFGMLIDKYGFQWMVNMDKPQ
jgi:PhnB protein